MTTLNPPGGERPHVVVIDDEADLCELLALRLEHHGYRASVERTIRGALEILQQELVDVMIVDLRLDGENGLDLLTEISQRALDLPVIVLTAHGTIETAVDAMSRGAYGFLTKPFHDHELLQKLAHAVERVRLRREVEGLRRIVGSGSGGVRLLGTSELIQAVRDVVARVAPTDVTVLLLGESGTGKEVAARALHAASHRATASFVAVNCGALPADLLESELFGYVRGAFTGAQKNKEGLFGAAHGGTIFLDEIGDAPLPVQVKLLRVLQERCFTPVGSTEETTTDVRVVAATNRDLRGEVAAGRFREDLYYRVHVVPVHMPALRDRREDVPLLAETFLAQVAARHGISAPQLTSEALRALLEHEWPGNVRELANVMEGAALLVTDGRLRREHVAAVLPPAPRTEGARVPEASGRAAIDAQASLPSRSAAWPPLREARDAFERAYLAEALRRSGGNVSAAARMAGRNRTDFHDLLRRHDLSPNDFRGGQS